MIENKELAEMDRLTKDTETATVASASLADLIKEVKVRRWQMSRPKPGVKNAIEKEDVDYIIKRMMGNIACDSDCSCKREYAIQVLNEVRKQVEKLGVRE